MGKEKSIHLQIEHKVPNFDGWKKAFENDPINRKKAGVRNYKIFRPFDDPNYVVIDLEFDNLKEAEDTLSALRNLWTKVEGKIMMNPQTRILDLVETVDV
ncbi:MAG: hypothetical protein Q8941_07285 [Bacteroidota bacterium]|nr:hypothetical protein [Bacteroidota bacterium]